MLKHLCTLLVPTIVALAAVPAYPEDADFKPLFADGGLESWHVSDWSNVATPQKVDGKAWDLSDGVLTGLNKRTWLYSDKDFGDFVLKFDWKVSKGANGGLGLRFPPEGDPAYNGMEIQIIDAETYYRGTGRPEQGTAAIYDLIAPKDPKINPVGEWNSYEVTCKGDHVQLVLNGKKVLDVDLSKQTQRVPERPDAKPLSERPREGRIGFQNLNGTVTIRNPMIKVLD